MQLTTEQESLVAILSKLSYPVLEYFSNRVRDKGATSVAWIVTKVKLNGYRVKAYQVREVIKAFESIGWGTYSKTSSGEYFKLKMHPAELANFLKPLLVHLQAQKNTHHIDSASLPSIKDKLKYKMSLQIEGTDITVEGSSYEKVRDMLKQFI